MRERPLLHSPSWVLAVVMGLSFMVGLYFMDKVFHGSGPMNVGFQLLAMVVTLLAFTVCGVAARTWWQRILTRNTPRD